ncbi:MAG TPA: hypothetical protein VGH74_15795 [Planctomycetaceae bacterium]|jgi:hypothetical protein
MQEVVQIPCLPGGPISSGQLAVGQSSQKSGEQSGADFVNRRQASGMRKEGGERRQFIDSRRTFRPEVIELAEAVDQYKLRHRRRFITFEELYDVIADLGYQK